MNKRDFNWNVFLSCLAEVLTENNGFYEHEGKVGCLAITEEVLDHVNEDWGSSFVMKELKSAGCGKELSRAICFKFLQSMSSLDSYHATAKCWLENIYCTKDHEQARSEALETLDSMMRLNGEIFTKIIE